jgi:hypothetical protein
MTMTVDRDLAAAELSGSAVSWAAIIAGAVSAAAFAIVLFTLGTGLGLASISPWGNRGLTASSIGALAIAWFIAIHLFSFGAGGYLAGRLRRRWLATHGDEVFFRDTAHGLLVWALGTILTGCIVASIVSGAASIAGQVGGSAAGAAASTAASDQNDPTSYFTDMLFRSDRTDQSSNADQSRREVSRIFVKSLTGDINATDKTYVAQVIARQTGLSQADAEQRLTQTVEQAKTAAKQAADTARKIAVSASLWAFVAMLVGAFAACYMAMIGGELRDDRSVTV